MNPWKYLEHTVREVRGQRDCVAEARILEALSYVMEDHGTHDCAMLLKNRAQRVRTEDKPEISTSPYLCGGKL